MIGDMSLIDRVRLNLLQDQIDAIAVFVAKQYFGEEIGDKSLFRRGTMLLTRRGYEIYVSPDGQVPEGYSSLFIQPLNKVVGIR